MKKFLEKYIGLIMLGIFILFIIISSSTNEPNIKNITIWSASFILAIFWLIILLYVSANIYERIVKKFSIKQSYDKIMILFGIVFILSIPFFLNIHVLGVIVNLLYFLMLTGAAVFFVFKNNNIKIKNESNNQ
jgi:hypothetical protein